ncbi:MAG: hypothetical protein QM770_19905 [Tepidisphaeraceae bacterium]
MARAKRVKSSEVPAKPERTSPPWWIHAVAGGVLVALLGVGGWRAWKFADERAARPDSPAKVVFINTPPWMSPDLIARIAHEIAPTSVDSGLDHKLLVDTSAMLKAQPWVKQVNQVRRVYGEKPGDTLQIDCEFRAPVAFVEDDGVFWMVDGDGVKLPEKFSLEELKKLGMGLEPKKQLRRITGVAQQSPQAGEMWKGDDLKAGLDMVRLMYGKPFLNEVIEIDVTNVGKRVDANAAQIVLRTVRGTEVRWGQPLNGPMYAEPTPDQKLATLQHIYDQYNRVDAGVDYAIDIRFDAPMRVGKDEQVHAQ